MALQELSRKTEPGNDGGIAAKLLAWYDVNHRDLPWRIGPHDLAQGTKPDPYRVWLSEIMLQQTTVEAVKSYFHDFIARWPTVDALASAERDDVMKAWAGLGYYSRARNLKACADLIAAQGGHFPDTEEALLKLPGIGPYTAAAIAAIAYGRPTVVVDGNIERVTSRLFSISTPLPKSKIEIRSHVERMVPVGRPGDFAQAIMDLGATMCTPRKPKCGFCPLRDDCNALICGDPERFPVRAAKSPKPLRRGAAFVAIRDDGAILLRKRVEKGLLGGMSEVPTTGWTARIDGETSEKAAPFPANWQFVGEISHIFTHFSLEIRVFCAKTNGQTPSEHFWSTPDEISGEALPSVMKKVIEAAIPGATRKRN